MSFKKGFLFCFVILIGMDLSAQGPQNFKPQFNRQLNHDEIDKAQKEILALDGKVDGRLEIKNNEEAGYVLTNVIKNEVDLLQYKFETDSTLDHRLKVNYLHGLTRLLQNALKMTKYKQINILHLPVIVETFKQAVVLERKSQSIAPLFSKLDEDVCKAILTAEIFDKNIGYHAIKNLIILKKCTKNPEKIFQILKENPDLPFADSLIKVVAPIYTDQLYNYSQARNTKLAKIILGIKDDTLIQTVTAIANNKSGQQLFPFLDNILSGKITIEEINDIQSDSAAFYKLLVKTQMDYVDRRIKGDTARNFQMLTTRLIKEANEKYINIINGLHDLRDLNVRFHSIQDLTPQELYYLAVSSDGAIYTSSFVRGIYPLMMKKVNNRGDSLLMSLNFDKYRKFIKMCAGFNTLGDFITTFKNGSDATDMMKAFVSNLEKTDGLEEGVDVADSYASIKSTPGLENIAKNMVRDIDRNYKRNEFTNSHRGKIIYNILSKLFKSAEESNGIDISKELNIPPVYEVARNQLADSAGNVVVQVFIYGDGDGIGVFPTILKLFNPANWKVDQSNKQWVTVRSTSGKPVTVYLNRPLPEATNEDALAQEALCNYLVDNDIVPTVTINRGHSYNAPYTINQMSTDSKIVFMGSCGGYNMMHDILEKAPDAHIIGTKQIADAPVNNPFLRLIAEKLRLGDDIKWIPFWKELGTVAKDEIFEDYVPPYKNLGAMFIKAFKIALEPQE